MPPAVKIHPKYEPLFHYEKGGPRYKVVTGGRGPGKSFAVSTANVCDTYHDDRAILYARYTLTSAQVSVIPEYVDKINLLGKARHFAATKESVINRYSKGVLYFKGILGSSGNQTARLKSIAKLRKFILDEAQELTSESDFDIIDLSIREKDVPNEVDLVLNPTDIHHWIYRRFFKEPGGVPFDFNGRIDDVQYIHTDWRDNRENLSPSFIAKALAMERRNPEKYQNIYLGDWAVKRNGLIYPNWRPCELADIPLGLDWWYGNDWGYSNDPDALVRMAFDPLTRTLYLVEVMYATGKLPRDVAAAIREDCARRGASADLAVVYCDPARPDSIAELRTQYGINALPGINRDKVGRIGYLQGFKVRYVGAHIGEEADTYSWEPSREDEDVFTDVPQDGGDHCFVGSTMVTTPEGDKRIDEIKEGDKVLTSNGFKTVQRVFDNGCKKIREYLINFGKFAVHIEGTPDHKIKTSQGWKQLRELRATDVLYLRKSLTEKNITSTQVSDISVGTTNGSTALSGNTITARSRMATTSTTRTATPGTMISRILNLWRVRLTSPSTQGSEPQSTGRISAQICGRRARPPKSGTAPRRAGHGTASTPWSKRLVSASNTPATTAGQSSLLSRPTPPIISALTSALRHIGARWASTISSRSASGAGRSLAATNTTSSAFVEPIVPRRIESISSGPISIEQVFDLQVEDMHEYLANGVLVHNCADAVSYGSTYLRRMGIPNDDGDLPQ